MRSAMAWTRAFSHGQTVRLSFAVILYVKSLLSSLPDEYVPVRKSTKKTSNMADLVEKCKQSVALILVWEEKNKRKKR